MSEPRCSAIEVHVFRRTGRRVSFLCLRRVPGGTLPGVWQPITGGRLSRESAVDAARREVREETGLAPARWWALETPSLYWNVRGGRPAILPVFVAEVPADAAVVLSEEHDRAEFVTPATAARRFLWDTQRRALADALRQIVPGGPLADALELPSAAALRARRRPAGPKARTARGRRG